MRNLFRTLRQRLEKESAVLVMVVASNGSTPRGAGAVMIVTAEGRISGTIGGGKVEYECEQKAREILRSGTSQTEHFLLHKNNISDLGMICGGNVDIYFHYIAAGDQDMLTITDTIEKHFRDDECFWLIHDITPGSQGKLAVYGVQSGLTGMEISPEVFRQLQYAPLQIQADGHTYYTENLLRPDKVYIFGGGHVSQALVPVLTAVDFSCVILEDRPEFCEKELFPGAYQTRRIDNNHILDFVQITDQDYVLIMTRGHRDDQTILAQALLTPAQYIGVIGSRAKSATVFANLREKGYADEDFARVHSPVGLPILAETPAEIAVSIAAQLILVRAQKTSASGKTVQHR